MGCWDAFCPLCGISFYNLVERINDYLDDYPELLTKISKIKLPKSNWATKCTVLLLNKKAKHGFIETACNIEFYNSKTQESYAIRESGNDQYDEKFGIVLHTDCWKLAKKILKRGLTLDDFDIKRMTSIGKKGDLWETYKLSYLNYKEVSKYHEQDFRIDQLCKTPKKIYVIYPPLSNNKFSLQNKKRITKNILRLDKYKPKIRSSPLQSATLFGKNYEMKGHDGRMYKIKTIKTKKGQINRWVLVKK